MKRLTACAFLLLFPATAQAAEPWPQECKLHRVGSFPMTRMGNLVTIPVAINGEPKNFMVDTGGYATSISQDTATAMKLNAHSLILTRIRDAGGKLATNYAYAKSFKLGGMEAKKFDLLIDQGKIPGSDGILAPDLLRNFDVEFDFAAMTLNLFRPHACEGKAAYWTQDYIVLPMEITESGHTRVDVTLDGKNMGAILDSGASFSVMTFGSARRFFGLRPDSEGVVRAGQLSGSQGGVSDSYRYPFKSLTMGDLSVGGVSVSNPRLLLADAPTVLSGEDVSLLLGMSEMRYLHLYFAYRERKLYISAVQAQ